ncbi:MAG: valine--tRNA ligase, partial [Candidatus Andersenbacteria bacterium]|nr:valine--tRNA ligase [Candidatus Andersenbacteria bacterium]
MAELAQQYRPDEHEPAVYRQWEKAGAFAPRPDAAGEPFVIMLPPPNITGSLHMGHALQDTIMDILIRWRRMQGRPTLWLPGTDHAAIATNRVLENQLRQEGTSRTAIGRERYLKRAAQWYREVGDTIVNQMKRLGCSCDWSRIRFTMDQPYIAAVQAAFVRYYQRGYIYRGNRLVNWCPSCASVVSDLEVVYREADTELVTLRYPLTDGGHTISVATTRPETMLGDTAVAVHPDDKRYQSLIGRTAVLPLVGRKIPVIADARVDPAFGTGAVKVTPAHDALDAAIGETHRLPAIKIIGEDGLLTDAAGQFAGLPAASARAAVLHALERDGVASERRTFKHSISLCDRCGHVIEPLLSRQWFVAMNKLKNETISTAANLISFIPQRWRKHFITWMENVHDWTISRQLWLGQSVPAWWRPGARGTANEAGNYVVSIVKPGSNSGLPAEDSGKGWEPDPDTLDTWFSSAIWPLATLGWPAATDDLARYYPTSVLVTARDILYLWV